MASCRSVFCMVKANKGSPGIDHQTIETFASRMKENLERVAQALQDSIYHPQAIKKDMDSQAGK